MANREEKKQLTEQHLYDVAIDLFCEQGYKQTTLTDIAARYPAIPASVAETHWRKSDAFLRMLNRKYAAHSGDGTLTQFVRDVAAEVADATSISGRACFTLHRKRTRL